MSSNWMSAPWNRLDDCRLTESRLSDRYPSETAMSLSQIESDDHNSCLCITQKKTVFEFIMKYLLVAQASESHEL